MIPRGYKVVVRKLIGAPYSEHVIVGPNGQQVYAQLSPYADGEVAERIAAFKNPTPQRPLPPFEYGRKTGTKTKTYIETGAGEADQ